MLLARHQGLLGRRRCTCARTLAPERPLFAHPAFDHETRIVAARGRRRDRRVDLRAQRRQGLRRQDAVPRGAGRVRGGAARDRRAASCCAATSTSRAPTCDVHPKERKPRAIGQLPEERALLERIIGAAASSTSARALDPDNDQLFTWWAPWRNMRQRNIGWRLDYVLASERARGARRRAASSQREVGTSDHAPGGGDVRDDGSTVMIVVSDFDGTLTLDDVTTYIWDKHLPYDWRREAAAADLRRAGDAARDDRAAATATSACRPRRCSPRCARTVRMRPGRRGAGAFCRGRGWPFVVVSHGLSFYIEALLPSVDPVHAFAGTFNEWSWQRHAAADDSRLRRARTSRAASSRICARAIRATRSSTWATAGSIFRRPQTCDRIFAVARQQAGAICCATPVARSRSSNRSTRSPPPCSLEMRC